MTPHRFSELSHVYETYTPELSHIGWELNEAVAKGLNGVAPPEGMTLHGTTVGTMVRQQLAWTSEGGGFGRMKLSSHIGPNLAIKFSNGYGVEFNVRKHPVDWVSRDLVPLPQLQTLPLVGGELKSPLFGPALRSHGLKMSVLWDADVKRMILRRAILAVVRDVENSSKTQILDFVPLPEKAKFNPKGLRETRPVPDINIWHEYFGKRDYGTDPDSA